MRNLTLTHLLHTTSVIGEQTPITDPIIASGALLGAAWRLIFEYRQLFSVMHGARSTGQWNSSELILSSRLTDLERLLDCLALNLHPSPLMTLSLQLLRIHLHVSLEEVHLFVGAEGHAEARRIFPRLQEWAATARARNAVYHAAQVLAAARTVHASCLRDFYCVAVYQCSLTLWVCGVVSSAATGRSPLSSNLYTTTHGSSPAEAGRELVALDVSKNNYIERFLLLDGGIPAIHLNTTGSILVPLTDPGSAMAAVMYVLSNNHAVQRPPLVENLLQLMNGLKVAV